LGFVFWAPLLLIISKYIKDRSKLPHGKASNKKRSFYYCKMTLIFILSICGSSMVVVDVLAWIKRFPLFAVLLPPNNSSSSKRAQQASPAASSFLVHPINLMRERESGSSSPLFPSLFFAAAFRSCEMVINSSLLPPVLGWVCWPYLSMTSS